MTIRDSVAGIASSIRVDRAKSRCAEAEIAASALSGPEQIATHVGNGDKMLFTNAPIPNKSLGHQIHCNDRNWPQCSSRPDVKCDG